MKNEVLHIREDIVLFFLLILLFSLPLWVAEHFIHVSALPDNLPITDVVATFVPMLSGFILYRSRNRGVGSEFIKKAVDFGKIRKPEWMILLVLMMPLLFLITYLLMQIFGIDFPDNYRIPVVTPLLFIGYLIAAAGEEMGYMGYAMKSRFRDRCFLGILAFTFHDSIGTTACINHLGPNGYDCYSCHLYLAVYQN